MANALLAPTAHGEIQPLSTPFSIDVLATTQWFVLSVPEGREAASAQRCAKCANTAVQACIAPQREKLCKVNGVWHTELKPLFAGYIFATSNDADQLATALQSVRGVRLASKAPLDSAASEWLASALDEGGVLRASEGAIHSGQLTVTRGPLQGREAFVQKVDRRKRQALVSLGRGEQQFSFLAALSVPTKD